MTTRNDDSMSSPRIQKINTPPLALHAPITIRADSFSPEVRMGSLKWRALLASIAETRVSLYMDISAFVGISVNTQVLLQPKLIIVG